MSYSLGQTYTDPWTRAASESYELAKRRGLGTEASLGPPPIKPIPWAMVVGWGAVVLVTGGVFLATTQGGTKPRANAKKRMPTKVSTKASKKTCRPHDWETVVSSTVIYTKKGERRPVSIVRCRKCQRRRYRWDSQSGKTVYFAP